MCPDPRTQRQTKVCEAEAGADCFIGSSRFLIEYIAEVTLTLP